MILGIFYARFLPQEGTKIVAQSPPGCIVASADTPNLKPPLLDFDIIQEYVIPRKAFFNRFITVSSPDDKYNVLGFPVSIPNERYHRNEFLFNFGLVVESDVDQIPYERLVRRLAVIFAEMERQSGYLSCEGTAKADEDGRRPIESLLEIIKEDLNNYGECMIPIDEANTLNMKLFPHQTAPPAVRGWHVPVPKMKLADIVDPTWDLTLQKIIPHVDGVNDVRRVAWLADVSLPLAQVALRHLLYYDTVLLLDMFFFGSCYAPRPGIHDFIANRDGLVDECAAYVCIRPPAAAATAAAAAAATTVDSSRNHRQNTTDEAGESRKTSTSGGGGGGGGKTEESGTKSEEEEQRRPSSRSHSHSHSNSNGNGNKPTTTTTQTTTKKATHQPTEPVVTRYQLIKLMTTFCVGRSVMEWVKLHRDGGFDVLRHVDVRRLVQFGVIKGLLYRVHKYVVSKRYLAQLATGQVPPPPPSRLRRGSSSLGTWHNNNNHNNHNHNTTNAENTTENGGGSGGGSSSNNKGRKSGGGAGRRVGHNNSHDHARQHGGGKAAAAVAAEAGSGGGGGGGAATSNVIAGNNPLRKYLDGMHCFDQIITEQNLTDAEIMEKLKSFQAPAGDLTVFYR